VAKAAGKVYFGTETDTPELSNSAYQAILAQTSYFAQLTPGNSMKWDATEPEQGTFSFTGGDQIVALAEKNGQIMRGHNCVWHNQLPSWVTNTKWTASELSAVVQNHCSTIVKHWAGKIYSWDVINEPLNEDGTIRSDVFYNTLGSSYIALALNAARTADPNAKLYINDYNIEYAGSKATGMINLVKQLKANGTPIDGVGLQCHFTVGQVPSTLQSNMQAFTALGVDVAITELDIKMKLPETAALLEQQKTDYQTVIHACKSVSRCVGVTIWDYTDADSWIPGASPGYGAACPWDSNLKKKPAYDGIIAGFTS